jgi:hypothetical protein
MGDEDWGFAEIERCDSPRARRLARAGSASELLSALEVKFQDAIDKQTARFGLDDGNPRAIIQFQIALEIYDWFFNARTGYRAQFWAAPDIGNQYNRAIVTALRKPFARLPDEITPHKVDVQIVGASRGEIDKGLISLRRETIIQSLDSQVAKIWICERLIQSDGSNPRLTLAAENAERYQPKLNIPRWAKAVNPKTGDIGEGMRAPYPDEPECWLDLKGGFVGLDSVYQLKSPAKRATDLFKRGWT